MGDNRALFKRFLDAVVARDRDTLNEVLHEDVTVHLPGDHHLAGVHRGRDSVLGFFAEVDAHFDGGVVRKPHAVLTDDEDHIVILMKVEAVRGGTRFAWDAANIWHVTDGQLREVWLLAAEPAGVAEAFGPR
jgi:uncharacterized protein